MMETTRVLVADVYRAAFRSASWPVSEPRPGYNMRACYRGTLIVTTYEYLTSIAADKPEVLIADRIDR
jgi:hypothetical protein